MRKRRLVVLFVSVCLVLVLVISMVLSACAKEEAPAAPAAPTTPAAPTLQWRLNTHAAPTQNLAEGARWWAAEVERRTGGRVEIEVFVAGALYGSKELLTSVQNKGVDVSMVIGAYEPAALPIQNGVANYAFGNADEIVGAQKALEEKSPAYMQELKDLGITYLGYTNGNPYYVISKPEVKSLADFKGLKMRTWGSAIPKLMEEFGCIPVSVSSAEGFEALQKGTLDASLTYWSQARSMSYYEAAKYYYEAVVPFQIGIFMASPVMNLEVYNSLPDDIQQILQDLKWDFSEYFLTVVDRDGAADRKILEDGGVNFITGSAAEYDTMIAAKNVVMQDWVDTMKADGLGDVADNIGSILDDNHAKYK